MLWPVGWRTARSIIKLGHSLYRRGKLDAAQRVFHRAMESNSYDGSAAGAWWLATMARERGDRATARSYYERTVASRHEAWAPRAATDLGDLFSEQGQVVAAANYYRHAIAFGDPANPGAIWARRAQHKLDLLLTEPND